MPPESPAPTGGTPRALRPDCANCFALCCVALPFVASPDFPVHKPAGRPCGHLRRDFRCGVHDSLRHRGYLGCGVFDCHGAGQRVSRDTFGGRDWRTHPELSARMFEVFPVVRLLHELLRYLHEAIDLADTRPSARHLAGDLRRARAETDAPAAADADSLAALAGGGPGLADHRERVNALLLRLGERVRSTLPGPRRNLRGADLAGADLRGADLRAATLRDALLIEADLRDADLRGAELIGIDARGADLRGADLRGAFFLTPDRPAAARGDERTRPPAGLARPVHW
ncbi:pentapeptide repeat-containing protein [Streptomyces calidiresistens]